MRFERRLPSLFAAAALLLSGALAAQPAPRTPTPAAVEDDKAGQKSGDEKPPKEESRSSRTTRSGSAARVPMHGDRGLHADEGRSGKLKANIFFMAYTKDGAGSPAGHVHVQRRPRFLFGLASPGAIGPKRVVMGDDGQPLPPPYRLVDNEYSWLAFTDLVFIDPVTTGYSRPAPGEKPEQFHGVEEDIASVGEFIRLYATRYTRWASPKFLAGESYGTTRAAGLSGYLQDRYGMYLNGIVLISTILNFQTTDFAVGNDAPYMLYLPSYTATAWYHKRLPADLQAGPLAPSRNPESSRSAVQPRVDARLDPASRRASGVVRSSPG
jgi:carboxypeptidase C (cathepsin A)